MCVWVGGWGVLCAFVCVCAWGGGSLGGLLRWHPAVVHGTRDSKKKENMFDRMIQHREGYYSGQKCKERRVCL